MSEAFHMGTTQWPGLAKLIEEAGEVQQVAGKLIQNGGHRDHWDGTDLFERLTDELGDLCAAIDFVVENQIAQIDAHRLTARRLEKRALFQEWHDAGRAEVRS